MKIRVGDTVAVIAGKDKRKTGVVLRVLASKNRVVVAGVNMRTKHVKKQGDQAGQRIQYEAALSASNVMVLDPKTKKPTRVRFEKKDGKKVRVAVSSGEIITASRAPKEEKATRAAGTKAAEKKTTRKESANTGKKPEGKAFWQRMGFGSEALEERAEMKEPSRMQQDQSVPDQVKKPETFQHSRGS